MISLSGLRAVYSCTYCVFAGGLAPFYVTYEQIGLCGRTFKFIIPTKVVVYFKLALSILCFSVEDTIFHFILLSVLYDARLRTPMSGLRETLVY